MVRALDAQLRAWETDGRVKRIVIEGAGDKAFCAGGDIRQLYDWGLAMDPQFLDFYREEYLLNTYIKHYPKPYIALLDGIVMGGGVGVSVHGSHRIVTEATTFAMPETGIGLFPDVGGTYFLPRCPGETGMYMGLTGARLKAGDAAICRRRHAFCSATTGCRTLSGALRTFDNVDEAIQQYAVPIDPETFGRHRGAIDRHFLQNSAEDVLESLRSDPSEWAQKQAGIVTLKSPTSLKICHRQLRDGLTLDFNAAACVWNTVSSIGYSPVMISLREPVLSSSTRTWHRTGSRQLWAPSGMTRSMPTLIRCRKSCRSDEPVPPDQALGKTAGTGTTSRHPAWPLRYCRLHAHHILQRKVLQRFAETRPA